MAFLDCFKDSKVSNNRFAPVPIDKEDEIVIGSTCNQLFDIPMNINLNQCDFTITYKQGLTCILKKSKSDCKIISKGVFGASILVKLFPLDTLKFRWTQLDTQAQIKIINSHGDILFSKAVKIKVIEPLSLDTAPSSKTILSKNLTLYNYYTLNYEKAYRYIAAYPDLWKNATFYGFSFCADNFVGVNFDSNYLNTNQQAVRVFEDGEDIKYSSIGMAYMPQFDEFYECRHACAEEILPFFITDGMNSAGVFCSLTTVYDEVGVAGIRHAVKLPDLRCYATMLPRFILNKCGSAIDAINYLNDYVTIDVQTVGEKYVPHLLIADKYNTFVIEFAKTNDKLELVINAWPSIYNFSVDGVEFNQDKTLFNPGINDILLLNQLDPRYTFVEYNSQYIASQNQPNNGLLTVASPELTVKAYDNIKLVNKVQNHGRGIERYNIMAEALRDLTGNCTKEAAKEILLNSLYTNTYREAVDPFWYSEYIGDTPFYDFNIDSVLNMYYTRREELGDKSILQYVLEDYYQIMNSMSLPENTNLFRTTHSGLYNLESPSLTLMINESLKEFEITL